MFVSLLKWNQSLETGYTAMGQNPGTLVMSEIGGKWNGCSSAQMMVLDGLTHPPYVT